MSRANNKWVTVATSVTDIEKEYLLEKARKNGMSLGGFIKTILLDENHDDSFRNLTEHDKKLYQLVNKIYQLSQIIAEKNLGSDQAWQMLLQVNQNLEVEEDVSDI